MRFVSTLIVVLISCTSFAAAGADENLLAGGDFEQGLAGWNEAWSRTHGVRAVLDREHVHGGRQSGRGSSGLTKMALEQSVSPSPDHTTIAAE